MNDLPSNEWLEFQKFWQGQIEPGLMENFFLVEAAESIRNLCWQTWCHAKKIDDKGFENEA